MKTIEIISGNQKSQFTTKSVTFDGKEYFYINMTNVSNNAEGCFYTFAYDGEIKMIPYEPKDAKTLFAIFGQVEKLQQMKPKAAASSAAAAEQKTADVAPVSQAGEPSPITEQANNVKTVNPQEETAASETAEAKSAEEKSNEQKPKTEKQSEKEKLKAEKQAAKEKKRAEKAAKKAGAEANPAAAGNAAPTEKEPMDPEKKAKIKKSLIIFGILISIMIILSGIYFFIFGTSSAPTVGPNSTESQQYNDIDELINDLQ